MCLRHSLQYLYTHWYAYYFCVCCVCVWVCVCTNRVATGLSGVARYAFHGLVFQHYKNRMCIRTYTMSLPSYRDSLLLLLSLHFESWQRLTILSSETLNLIIRLQSFAYVYEMYTHTHTNIYTPGIKLHCNIKGFYGSVVSHFIANIQRRVKHLCCAIFIFC